MTVKQHVINIGFVVICGLIVAAVIVFILKAIM